MATAIYGRQSIDKKDSISIETQIELCKRELTPDEKFRVYTDKGFSGKNTNRPEFRQMIEDVEAGDIDRIVIYRLDRISRSISDFASIMDILEAHSVSFTSVNEKFDTKTPMGRAMLYIIMIFAQLERETIAERIKDNYYQRGKSGAWLGGPAPFGFKIEKADLNGKKASRLKPAKELDIIKYIFDEYASTNKSLGKIAEQLTEAYGKTYGMWNNIKLSRLLHNPIYVKGDADVYNYYKERGCILINEIEEYDGVHSLALYGKRDRNAHKYNDLTAHVVSLSLTEGVIDSDIFLACQYKLNKNRQIKNTGRGKHSWLSGLLKCGHCGYGLVVKVYNGKKYLYCTGYQDRHLCPAEKQETLYLDAVESMADELIYDYLQNVDRIGITDNTNEDDNKKNQLKIKIYKINEQIDSLISKLVEAEGATIDYINRKVNELDSEKQVLMAELNQFTSDKISVKIPTPKEWSSAGLTEKRELARLIINKVLVTKNNIEIIWKY